MQVWKTLKRKPPQLEEGPELPEELTYLWQWFRDLFSSSKALDHVEIQAWSQLNGIQLAYWELQVLRALDRKFWEIHYGS